MTTTTATKIKVSVIDEIGIAKMKRYGSLSEAIAETREQWDSDPWPECYVFQKKETGEVVATMNRGPEDPEVAITVLYLTPVPTVERHRCRHILDSEGRYARSEVTELTN